MSCSCSNKSSSVPIQAAFERFWPEDSRFPLVMPWVGALFSRDYIRAAVGAGGGKQWKANQNTYHPGTWSVGVVSHGHPIYPLYLENGKINLVYWLRVTDIENWGASSDMQSILADAVRHANPAVDLADILKIVEQIMFLLKDYESWDGVGIAYVPSVDEYVVYRRYDSDSSSTTENATENSIYNSDPGVDVHDSGGGHDSGSNVKDDFSSVPEDATQSSGSERICDSPVGNAAECPAGTGNIMRDPCFRWPQLCFGIRALFMQWYVTNENRYAIEIQELDNSSMMIRRNYAAV